MHGEKFAISGKIEFERIHEEYPPFVMLYGSKSSAKIALHGAQVLSFVPKGGEDLLWVGENAIFQDATAIRGGIPICWPWFGGAGAPSHGFARIMEWEVVRAGVDENGDPHLTLRLESNDETKKLWDHDFCLELAVSITDALEMRLTTRNCGEKPFAISEALHSYFRVGEIENIEVLGQAEAITFCGETDCIYEDFGATNVIVDKTKARYIVIEKENSQSTVVWNPWITKSASMGDMAPEGYREMVCVESANIAPHEVTIEGGKSHTVTLRIKQTDI